MIATLSWLVMLPLLAPANALELRWSGKHIEKGTLTAYRVTATTSAPDTTDVTILVDGERQRAVEVDAWRAATARLEVEPTAGSTLSLLLEATDGTSMGAFSGGVSEAGVLDLSATPDPVGPCRDCTVPVYDIEVLAVHTWTDSDGVLQVALDLAGADSDLVAAGTLVVYGVEDDAGRVVAPLEMGGLQRVWEAVLPDDISATDPHRAQAQALDREGRVLEQIVTTLAAPWGDDGLGAPAVPLTGAQGLVAVRDVKELADILKADYGIEPAAAMLVSSSWPASDTLPLAVDVTWVNGEGWSLPVGSYQQPGGAEVWVTESVDGAVWEEAFEVTVDGRALSETLSANQGPVCDAEVCVSLTQTWDGAWWLSATELRTDARGLSSERVLSVELTPVYGWARVEGGGAEVTLDDTVTALAGAWVDLGSAPAGAVVAGRVRWHAGRARWHAGRREWVRGTEGSRVGSVRAAVGQDAEGDVGLEACPRTDVAPRGDILIGGEPIGFERTGPLYAIQKIGGDYIMLGIFP